MLTKPTIHKEIKTYLLKLLKLKILAFKSHLGVGSHLYKRILNLFYKKILFLTFYKGKSCFSCVNISLKNQKVPSIIFLFKKPKHTKIRN